MPNDYTNISKEYAEGRAIHAQARRATLGHGADSPLPIFWRFVILDVVFDPTTIDSTKLSYWEHELGVSNIKHATVAPRNSIIARRVIGSGDVAEQPMVLYPMLPPSISLPCNPGEHVWVMFEDPAGTQNDLGYWMCRIVGPSFVEDANHTHAPRAYDSSFTPGTQDKFDGSDKAVYEFRNGKAGTIDGERYTQAETAFIDGDDDSYKKLMLESDGGRLNTYEPVPRFRKRPSDISLEGTNNTLIVLGKDRTGPVAVFDQSSDRGQLPNIPLTDSTGPGAGSIDIVVGRGQTQSTRGNIVNNDLPGAEIGKADNELVLEEGDPDFANDRSRIYISERTHADTILNLGDFNVSFSGGTKPGTASEVIDVSDSEEGEGAVIIKSDKIRMVARSDIQLLVTTYTKDENGRMVVVEDTEKWASIVIKSSGDIVFKPSEYGTIKLGGDDADKALVCTDVPASVVDGYVNAAPIVTTMGGQFAGTKIQNQGMYASKVLVTGYKK